MHVNATVLVGDTTSRRPTVRLSQPAVHEIDVRCLICDLRGELRSISGWLTLYEQTRHVLGREQIERLVETVQKHVWKVRRTLSMVSTYENDNITDSRPTVGRMAWNYRKDPKCQNRKTSVTALDQATAPIRPVLFAASAFVTDSETRLILHLRDLVDIAIKRLASVECTALRTGGLVAVE